MTHTKDDPFQHVLNITCFKPTHPTHVATSNITWIRCCYVYSQWFWLYHWINTSFSFYCYFTDEEASLLSGLNSYRATLNLTTLTPNDRAKCLADKIADQFKKQPCTNTTGSNTVPGTEPEFSNFPDLLDKCHLNVTTTRDGTILPACVPNLDPTLVLSNYTQSQYSNSLNDTKYAGIGIGSQDNWIVVVLTTNTPEGGYSPGSNDIGFVSKIGVTMHFLMFVLVAVFSFLWVWLVS